MSSLSTLLRKRWQGAGSPTALLEKGELFVYNKPAKDHGGRCCVCFEAPASGWVEVEAWGAGGSAATTCCCSVAIPPNPGSYAYKKVFMEKGERIHGCVACSSAGGYGIGTNTTADPTKLCVGAGSSTNLVITANSGTNGSSWCYNSSKTEFVSDMTNCFCATRYHVDTYAGEAVCGYYCNHWQEIACANNTESYAQATGGDINIYGGISCLFVGCCNPGDVCSHVFFMRTPPMRHYTEGTTLIVPNTCCNDFYYCSYSGNVEYMNMIRLMGKHGYQTTNCWSSALIACAESHKTLQMLPPAFPGSPTSQSISCRNYGYRGGDGQVRIKFLRDSK